MHNLVIYALIGYAVGMLPFRDHVWTNADRLKAAAGVLQILGLIYLLN